MGIKAIFHCNGCGNEFEANEGGGFYSEEYRCVDCDSIKNVKTDNMGEPIPQKNLRCRKCKGEMQKNLHPMCKKCKSRDVTVKKTLINYD